MLTALALDTVGHAFQSGYSQDEKLIWCASERVEFPEYQDGTKEYIGSSNSQFFSLTLLALAESNPIDKHDLKEFIADFTRVLDRCDTKPTIIPIAIAIGYYAALNLIPMIVFFAFCEKIFGTVRASTTEREAALFLSYMIYSLSYRNDAVIYTLDEAVTYDLLVGKFGDIVKMMMDKNLDPEFLMGFDPGWVAGMSYLQNALLNVVFLMLRVDLAYPKEILNCLPREQIQYVFNTKGIAESDMGFIFGAMCTASEHKHPLVPKPLRESVYFRGVVDSALHYA